MRAVLLTAMLGLALIGCASDPTASDESVDSTARESDPNVPLEHPTERPAGCSSEPGSATDLTAEPLARLSPVADWERWTDETGCEVGLDVISQVAGPQHCGWETTTLITMGTPIGTPIPTGVASDETRTFIWDPDQVLVGIDGIDRSVSLPIEDLPGTAADTGFRHGNTQLWLDDGDPTVAYLVADGMADRLVVDEDHQILCM